MVLEEFVDVHESDADTHGIGVGGVFCYCSKFLNLRRGLSSLPQIFFEA